ncbi:hypothetical protein [Hahella sp. CR1]|uniref:hypothetical protein n=1 Tax=unclassified Hahella TaxID=2624107 RepID=UPI0024432627|nr:hypothetical protein [Hahella sp. CR1]MDG9666553.1 hypothetical protein [Hahella sp. CR1]
MQVSHSTQSVQTQTGATPEVVTHATTKASHPYAGLSASPPSANTAPDNAGSMSQTALNNLLPTLRRSDSMELSHLEKSHSQGVGITSQGRVSVIRNGAELQKSVAHTQVMEKISERGQTKTKMWDAGGSSDSPAKTYTKDQVKDNTALTKEDAWGTGRGDIHKGNNSRNTPSFEANVSKQDAEALMLSQMQDLVKSKIIGSGNLQKGDVVRLEFHGNEGPCDGCKGRLEAFTVSLKAHLETKGVKIESDIFYNQDAVATQRAGSDTSYGWLGAIGDIKESYLAETSRLSSYSGNQTEILSDSKYGSTGKEKTLHGARLHFAEPPKPSTADVAVQTDQQDQKV